MAVRTAHVALGKLNLDEFPGPPKRQHLGDVLLLLAPDMRELEDDDIALSTVNTGVLKKVFADLLIRLIASLDA